ncbi:MAG: glycosyltransferase family 2 protein [Bacteroidota bacterium]
MNFSLFLWIVTGLIFFYAVICSFYNFIFAFASLFYKRGTISDNPKTSFLVLIPAYKEDEIIIDSALRNASVIDYPMDKFQIVVIADQLQTKSIEQLNQIGPNVSVHEVAFEKSTKVKSLNSAISAHTQDSFDHIVILDADNVVAPDFLKRVNTCVEQGYKAIQGRRKAKNKNNDLSLLDGLSEEINNSIFRKGGNVLRFSSPISGSGMSYEYDLLKEIMESEGALGGFDKMLQIRVVERRVKIKYCAEAVVYDEKTDDQAVFKNQRKRWLNSHFTYFKRFVGNGFTGLFKLNFDLFNLAIFIHGLLPRSFNVIILGALLVISILTPDVYFLHFTWCFVLFSMFLIANLLAIPREYWNIQLLKAGLSLPRTMLNMFIALLKINESKKSFIHTPHKKHSTNE